MKKKRKILRVIFVKAIIIHVVVEMIGGAFGLAFGKWLFEFLSGNFEEANISSGIASLLVSSISSIIFKPKRGDSRSP